MSRFRVLRVSRASSDCEHTRELLSSYLDDELEPSERPHVERHVAFCPRCRTVLANLRLTLGALGALGSGDAADDEGATETALQAWRDWAAEISDN